MPVQRRWGKAREEDGNEEEWRKPPYNCCWKCGSTPLFPCTCSEEMERPNKTNSGQKRLTQRHSPCICLGQCLLWVGPRPGDPELCSVTLSTAFGITPAPEDTQPLDPPRTLLSDNEHPLGPPVNCKGSRSHAELRFPALDLLKVCTWILWGAKSEMRAGG